MCEKETGDAQAKRHTAPMTGVGVVLLASGRCPNCRSDNLYKSPGGGVSADTICCDCKARYRHGLLGPEAIFEPREDSGASKEEVSEAIERLDAMQADHEKNGKIAQGIVDAEEKKEKYRADDASRERELRQHILNEGHDFHNSDLAFLLRLLNEVREERDSVRKRVALLETASYADSVQGEAAWRERCAVAELALVKKIGEAATMRCIAEQQIEFLRTGCDIQPQRAQDEAKVLIRVGRRILEHGDGELGANVVRTSIDFLVGKPGARESWSTAVRELMETIPSPQAGGTW